MKKELHAFTIDTNKKIQRVMELGNDLTDSEVEEVILSLTMKHGTATIEISPEPDIVQRKLTLYAENGNYLILLGENNTDNEWVVRTLEEKSTRPRGLVNIHGEPYPNRAITQDIHLVTNIFKEFYRTGDVSHDLLN
jgi:hypothetical protein